MTFRAWVHYHDCMAIGQPGLHEQTSHLIGSEPQPKFHDSVQKMRDRLKAEIFTRSSHLFGLPDISSLTLKQVREMFFVKELASLRDSTSLEETNQLQQWPRISRQEGTALSVRIESDGNAIVSAYDLDPSSRNGEQYTNVHFSERPNFRYKKGRIYEMALQTDNRKGNSTRLMGTYATGLLFDRVSLRYFSNGQMREVKKTFLRNPLTALRKSPRLPSHAK